MVIHLVSFAYTSQTVSNQMALKRHVLVLVGQSALPHGNAYLYRLMHFMHTFFFALWVPPILFSNLSHLLNNASYRLIRHIGHDTRNAMELLSIWWSMLSLFIAKALATDHLKAGALWGENDHGYFGGRTWFLFDNYHGKIDGHISTSKEHSKIPNQLIIKFNV